MSGQVPQAPGEGCAKRIGIAAAVMFVVWVGAQTCTSQSSTVAPPSPTGPVEQGPYLQGLCEGRDFVEYDDCKEW